MQRCRLPGAAPAPLADVVAGDNCFPSRRPQLCSRDLLPPSPLSDSLLCSQPSPSTSAGSLIPGNGLKIDVFLPPPLHQPVPTASPPNSLPPLRTCRSFCTLRRTSIVRRAIRRRIELCPWKIHGLSLCSTFNLRPSVKICKIMGLRTCAPIS